MSGTKFTLEDYQNLNRIFTSGNISSSSKKELEQYATMLSRPRAIEHFGTSYFNQACETVRLLILVRISEESNAEATRISTIAFRVAALALLVAVFQTGMSILAHISPPERLVPIQKQIEEEICVKPMPRLHKLTQDQKKSLPTNK